jgi:hypothetical protein
MSIVHRQCQPPAEAADKPDPVGLQRAASVIEEIRLRHELTTAISQLIELATTLNELNRALRALAIALDEWNRARGSRSVDKSRA